MGTLVLTKAQFHSMVGYVLLMKLAVCSAEIMRISLVKEDKILLRINRSMTTLNSATRGLNSRQKNIEARMRRVSQSITVYLIWEEKTKESSITLVYSGRTYLSQISSVILHDLAFPREQPLYYQCWLTEKDLDGSVDACHGAIWYCCFHAFANADLVIRSTCVLFFFFSSGPPRPL